MKAILLILALWGCSFEPEIQVEQTCLRFVSVEVSERSDGFVYIYRFVDDRRIEYVQYSKYLREFKVGECVPMMVRR